ncbi:ABC transporter ATP-binding protein [Nocardiopsis halotolerans]|uniref:ABC transporter ATP-binding protein n=1 Tax=Nocardiopsis halotolerans TaxID=124252 RepID=UPI00034C3F71|nr:ATP-binding cassette domain-containing protein [Nocardiopsis halotolerans]
MIVVENLVKEFRVPEREEGLSGSLRTLLTRRYRTVRAVDGVSFDIPAGSRTAYLGANGAGKSTTVKMLTGVMTPTSGHCLVNGLEPYRNRRRTARRIGVVFGQRSQLWWDLSVPDSFRILRRIHDIPDAVYQRNLRLFRELLDIDALATTAVRQLSLGQRMRAEIAASLLHDPEVLFWDEPTIGLDMVLQEAVRELVNRVNRELGTTVLLTSHDLADITSICDTALVVDHGRVIYQGRIDQLLSTAGQRCVIFEYRGGPSPEAVAAEVEHALPGTRVRLDGQRVRIDHPVGLLSSREVLSFLLERVDLTECYVPEPDLGTVLKELYTRNGHRGRAPGGAA